MGRWAEGPVALCRIALAPGDSRPPSPQLHQHGSKVAAADMRLPATPDDCAAHGALFQALQAGGFPEALDGDFALAVWDRNRKTLTLARDRLGIRPLFLARTRMGGIAFASFPDALIDAGIVEGRFDAEAYVQLVLGDARAGARTWIQGVERVPAGHVITFAPEGEHVRRYWRYPRNPPTTAPDDHAQAARALRSELEAAVARALPAGGPICANLSGGIDSGAIVALCSRMAGPSQRDVTAYCVTMPESDRHLGALDEAPTARLVAGHSGATLVTYPFDMVRDGLFRPMARTFNSYDNPDFAYLRIAMDAAARGADRILCGYGGDHVVSYTGEGALLADLLALRWRALRRTARELHQPLWRALARQAASDLLPPWIEGLLRQATGRASGAASTALRPVRRGFRPSANWAPGIGAARRQRNLLENNLCQHRLEGEAWRAAGQGLRYVFPLLDWRLIEFGAGVPARLQLHGGMRRALFRSAVADLLPAEIVGRPTKLAPFPTVLYDLAVNRETLVAEARRLATSPAAVSVIDLGEIERQLAALPEPESVAEAIRAEAAAGRQLRDPRITLLTPFVVARALAQNEAECAARAGSRPRAA